MRSTSVNCAPAAVFFSQRMATLSPWSPSKDVKERASPAGAAAAAAAGGGGGGAEEAPAHSELLPGPNYLCPLCETAFVSRPGAYGHVTARKCVPARSARKGGKGGSRKRKRADSEDGGGSEGGGSSGSEGEGGEEGGGEEEEGEEALQRA